MMKPVTLLDLTGWYHPGSATRGVVIVPALGFEELTSRRSLRILADDLSHRGVPVLRFDFHGTADSLGHVMDADRLERWTSDVHTAIDWLRDHAGVHEVTLVGLRFGALMAARIASEREDIAQLALLAPPVSGKTYLREQAMLASVIGNADPLPDGVNVAGFCLSRETVDAIRSLTWTPPAVPVSLLLCEAGPAMAQARILAAFGGQAIRLESLPFQGYEAMICDPTASIVPRETLTSLADHLAEGASGHAEPLFALAPPDLRGPHFSEKGVIFGEDQRLAGILCEPLKPHPKKPVIVLANAGGSPHIGWARGTVDLARRLAAEGIASLRVDMGGLGDSRAVFEREEPHHYLEETRRDLVAAVDLLQGLGYEAITLSGICSGAHHSFHAALLDERVKTVILVNTLCFLWGRDYSMPLNAWSRARASSISMEMQKKDAETSLLTRLRLRLYGDGLQLAKSSVKFVLRQAAAMRKPMVMSGAGLNAVLKGFKILQERGTGVHLIYSADDPGLAELEKYAGDDLTQTKTLPGVVKWIIPGADHTFTPQIARDRLAGLYLSTILKAAETPDRRRDDHLVLHPQGVPESRVL